MQVGLEACTWCSSASYLVSCVRQLKKYWWVECCIRPSHFKEAHLVDSEICQLSAFGLDRKTTAVFSFVQVKVYSVSLSEDYNLLYVLVTQSYIFMHPCSVTKFCKWQRSSSKRPCAQCSSTALTQNNWKL